MSVKLMGLRANYYISYIYYIRGLRKRKTTNLRVLVIRFLGGNSPAAGSVSGECEFEDLELKKHLDS